MIDIVVVNINNLEYTKNLVSDLLRQSERFSLMLVDQNSSEKGTLEYFASLSDYRNIDLVIKSRHTNLNRIWNEFYLYSFAKYLCFLNNDTRIPSNFVKDTVEILDREPEVGCVIHSSNHPYYQKTTKLNYEILLDKAIQGFDFTMRKEAYSLIPDELDTFGGDDYLFINLYKKHWRVACALSSPIIHYKAQSRKYFTGDRNLEKTKLDKYRTERIPYYCKFSKPTPKYKEIIECEI